MPQDTRHQPHQQLIIRQAIQPQDTRADTSLEAGTHPPLLRLILPTQDTTMVQLTQPQHILQFQLQLQEPMLPWLATRAMHNTGNNIWRHGRHSSSTLTQTPTQALSFRFFSFSFRTTFTSWLILSFTVFDRFLFFFEFCCYSCFFCNTLFVLGSFWAQLYGCHQGSYNQLCFSNPILSSYLISLVEIFECFLGMDNSTFLYIRTRTLPTSSFSFLNLHPPLTSDKSFPHLLPSPVQPP